MHLILQLLSFERKRKGKERKKNKKPNKEKKKQERSIPKGTVIIDLEMQNDRFVSNRPMIIGSSLR